MSLCLNRDDVVSHFLHAFDEVCVRASGHCMRPFLRDGAEVRLRSTRTLRPRVGDVVLVRTAGGLKLHRLQRWTSQRAQTRPDHGPLDAQVTPADVLAVVVEVDRRPARPSRLAAFFEVFRWRVLEAA